MDLAKIAEARTARFLSDVVGQRVPLKYKAGEYQGLCPFHQEKTPSFYVNDKKFFYHCFGCGAHGDAIDFVMRYDGVGFAEAVAWLLGHDVALPRQTAVQIQHARMTADEDTERRQAMAHEIWMRREPLAGTLAERYLREVRKIRGRLPDQLGYVPECFDGKTKRPYPALIAAVQDSHGVVTALQRIFLNEFSGDAIRLEGKRHKATIGPMGAGAVRLSPAYSETLGIAGSIEDALAARQIFSLPVWAACGESRLASVDIPEHVRRLILFGDSDEAGQREAARALVKIAHRYGNTPDREALEIEIMLPDGPKDWNAAL